MITIRRGNERGFADHGWLKSFHTFSFAGYRDSRYMGFRSLRVINEDRVAPGQGFGTHPHRDMEIISYVLEGQLAHKDSMGTGSVILPGDFQYMSAGSGVTHSEYNPQEKVGAHFLQIWIVPQEDAMGLPPRYDQKSFRPEQKAGKLCLVASPTGEDGSIAIRQDARLYISELSLDQKLDVKLAPRRSAWLHCTKGRLKVNDETELVSGDALNISLSPSFGEASPADYAFHIQSLESPSEFLFFDLN